MISSLTTLPPLWYEAQAQKPDGSKSALDQMVLRATRRIARPFRRIGVRGAARDLVERAGELEEELSALNEDELDSRVEILRERLRIEGLDDALIAEGFAIVREMADRTIGMRHFDVQLEGGLALLQGAVAEMETGEGKTLAATLAASLP